jgi:hypothetical protein
MQTTILPCNLCGNPVEILSTLAATITTAQCPKCSDRAQRYEKHETQLQRQVEAFGRCCPPCFADTEVSKLPCPALSDSTLRWRWSEKGIHLYGIPGSGKTRTLSILVRRAIFTAHSVICLGPGTFSQQCQAKAWHRGPWLKRLATVDLLFVDDIDKLNLTREMEKDFFSVITARAGFRPTYSTSNSDRDRLANLFRVTSQAMARRVFDYNYRIRFDAEDFGK